MAIRRVVLSFVCLVTTSLSASANSDEAPSARAIIDKAIAFYPTVVQQFANGKKLVELQTTDLKFLDAVEDGTFAQP